MKLSGHFWYSDKQRSFIERSNLPINWCEIDGELQIYTFWTDTKEHNCKWNDMTYLGYGVYHHSDPI